MKTIKGKELENKTLEVLRDGTLRIIDEEKFVPKTGEVFYYILRTGLVSNAVFDAESELYSYLLKHTFVFRTKIECEEYKTYLDLLKKYSCDFSIEDWKSPVEPKYYIACQFGKAHQIHVGTAYRLMYTRIYFKKREHVSMFIDEAGEYNIKKFMFNIWEEV